MLKDEEKKMNIGPWNTKKPFGELPRISLCASYIEIWNMRMGASNGQ